MMGCDDGLSSLSDAQLAPRGLLVLEGAFLVERALSAGLLFEKLYCVGARSPWAAGLGLEAEVLPEAEIARLAGYPFHRGVLGIARRPPELSVESALPEGKASSIVLVLPEIGDPENLGAAFRSAAALGASALLLGPGGPDPLSRRALRVSMGAALSLRWARLGGPEDLPRLSRAGYRLAACVLDPGAADVRGYSRPDRLALVLGNEAYGLSAPWLSACGTRLTLEMLGGTDSLNVSTAAAIFLYELGPGRRIGG